MKKDATMNKLNHDIDGATSHEIRNILTALASSGLLLENYIQSEMQKEKQLRHIRLIRQSTEELIKHVDDFFPVEQEEIK
jgi:signal transduction histidine kinase